MDGIASYSCVCQDGLTGPNCEIDIDDCEVNRFVNVKKYSVTYFNNSIENELETHQLSVRLVPGVLYTCLCASSRSRASTAGAAWTGSTATAATAAAPASPARTAPSTSTSARRSPAATAGPASTTSTTTTATATPPTPVSARRPHACPHACPQVPTQPSRGHKEFAVLWCRKEL